MNAENMKVLTNVIGAVESGGQIYGNRRYEAYADPYTNSSNEHTITLGWAQNYGSEAKRLIQRIYDEDPAAFKKIDKSGAIKKKLATDWVAEKWKPTASQKKLLISLITSDAGKKCQDDMFAEVMEKFIADCAAQYSKDVKVQMMYCEIRHLGGAGPVKRIFDRISGTITVDKIMASLAKDQEDTSNNNQVGDAIYWSRHVKCSQFITQYAVDEQKKEVKTVGVTAADVLNVMRSWLGMSRDAQTHRPIIDIYNSYRPLARGYAVTYWDDYCDATVSAVFIKLGAVSMIGGTECGVHEHIQIFKNKGIWKGRVKPSAGWIITFDWDGDGVADHIGFVESVSGNTITCIEGNTNGGVVGRRTIAWNDGSVYGYAAPAYGVECLVKGDSGEKVKDMQTKLIKVGYSCGKKGADGLFGDDTEKALKKFQADYKLTVDGQYGPQSKAALEAAYEKKVKAEKPAEQETGKQETAGSITAPKSSSKFAVSGSGSPNTTQVCVGQVTADLLNVRTWAGTSNARIKNYPYLASGNKVAICDAILAKDGSTWYYVKIANKWYGFVSADWIKKV